MKGGTLVQQVSVNRKSIAAFFSAIKEETTEHGEVFIGNKCSRHLLKHSSEGLERLDSCLVNRS